MNQLSPLIPYFMAVVEWVGIVYFLSIGSFCVILLIEYLIEVWIQKTGGSHVSKPKSKKAKKNASPV